MHIKQRIEALTIAFNGLSQIPNETFVSACTGIINNNTSVRNVDNKVWRQNVNKVISEYWSEIYELYEQHDWAWMSSQDFSDQVHKELNTLSYFS